jgi:hypothetical protein
MVMLCFIILLYVVDKSIRFDVSFTVGIEEVEDLIDLEILPGQIVGDFAFAEFQAKLFGWVGIVVIYS